MSFNPSIITHPAKYRLIVIREDYLLACMEGNPDLPTSGAGCAAFILSAFDYWTSSRLENREQAKKINDVLVRAGGEATQVTDLWIRKTYKDIAAASFGIYNEATIRVYMPYLIEREFIKTRTNPVHKWDRTIQYFFNFREVQKAVDGLKNRVEISTNGDEESHESTRENPRINAEDSTPQYEESHEAIKESVIESTIFESLLPDSNPSCAHAGGGLTVHLFGEEEPQKKERKKPESDFHAVLDAVIQIGGGIVNFNSEGAAAKQILALGVNPPVRPDEVAKTFRYWFERRDVARFGSSLHSFKQAFPALLKRLREGVPLEGTAVQEDLTEHSMISTYEKTKQRIQAKERQEREYRNGKAG